MKYITESMNIIIISNGKENEGTKIEVLYIGYDFEVIKAFVIKEIETIK